ncbi:hypothetical protein [uncultured Jatrophihabitans sp.]|uniref:hypothetical protein n=1 Tax=uncultured Jatrophihabitans sp. TaxID=1610747 RepID=UPI0035CA4F58
MTPSGTDIDCGNAFHAISYSSGVGNGVAPTVGELCHPLGVHRFVEIAILTALGLTVSAATGLLHCRARNEAETELRRR